METLLSIAIALCAGLLVSRFVKPLKLPAVTGYLIAGILIGPYCLGKLGVQGLGFPTTTDVKALSLFNDVALGFIAFAHLATSSVFPSCARRASRRRLSAFFRR